MEKELNIASILKDKPQGTKLYDLLYNVDVELDTISTTDTETVVWCTNETDNNTTCHRGYSEFGTIRGCPDGLQILLPSKEMRYWRKFAWKKGDVLVNSRGLKILFDRWASDNYTSFYAKTINLVEDAFLDTNLHTLASEKEAKSFIRCIEEKFGGKLNLETLEIEQPKSEFKDGDIVFVESSFIGIHTKSMIAIFNKDIDNCYEFYFALCNEDYDAATTLRILPIMLKETQVEYIRLATDSEKQQLFSALEKEGKRWNPDTKKIEGLPKKCEFKPFDKVLVRDYLEDKWMPNIFSCYDGTREYKYGCIAGNIDNVVFSKYCIPYNEETKHLLGTTDDWEGGEG